MCLAMSQQVPTWRGVVPAGWYMLFIMNGVVNFKGVWVTVVNEYIAEWQALCDHRGCDDNPTPQYFRFRRWLQLSLHIPTRQSVD